MRWAEVKPHLQSIDSFSQYLSIDRGTLYRLARTGSRYYRRDEDEKSDGRIRVYYKPWGELKRVQSLIHKKILVCAPFHKSIHGYRKGRSQCTAAAPHSGKPMLLKADVRDFFPSIKPLAVYKAFRQIGVPDQVSRLIVKLCAHENQLPQGAPTSPLISNLIWGKPARRIQGFSDQQLFDSTILGDDVFVSGARRAGKYKNLLKRIIQEEGLVVNERKTQALPNTTRQVAAGLVVNKRPNVKKEYRRAVRQVLHHRASRTQGGLAAAYSGPNKSSLAGMIAFVKHINPSQGQKLQREFDRIDWEEGKKGVQ